MTTGAADPHPSGYQTPEALWTAVNDRIRRRVAADPLLTVGNLQRQFVYDRLLCRVFDGDDDHWVLKGGTALLARVRSARHSQDVDLLRQAGTVDAAVAELRQAVARDQKDHFRFVTRLDSVRQQRPGQPGTQVATVKVEGYAGVRQVATFSVDIVVGSVITAEPEPIRPVPVVSVAGLPSPDYRLYPLVDHIADKLCATFERFGAAQAPSSRVRDLVDLVVIARTQTVHAAALHQAIEAEQTHRRLPAFERFATPARWANTYPAQARNVALCEGYRTYPQAVELVGQFLDPVLSGVLSAGTWLPEQQRWAAVGEEGLPLSSAAGGVR